MANKGFPYEREICHLLTKWWTGDPDADVVIWRTAGSGGRATTRRKKGKTASRAHCGDITAVDECAQCLTDLITFEIKRGYPDATIGDLLDAPLKLGPRPLEEMFEQTMAAAERAGTPHWALIHRRDRKDALIYVPAALIADLKEAGCFGRPPFPYLRLEFNLRTSAGLRPLRVSVLRLEDFLVSVTPEDVRWIVRNLYKEKS